MHDLLSDQFAKCNLQSACLSFFVEAVIWPLTLRCSTGLHQEEGGQLQRQ
jgi:hypothetical protein